MVSRKKASTSYVDTPTAFGIALRKIRKQKNLTQEKLADMLGMCRNHIGLLERGERDPKISTFSIIADGLGISIIDLSIALQHEIDELKKK
jgi:transcriptional regulator with XRE-family HTH domain